MIARYDFLGCIVFVMEKAKYSWYIDCLKILGQR